MARSNCECDCVEDKMKDASVIISDRDVSHRQNCDSVLYYRGINTGHPVENSPTYVSREKRDKRKYIAMENSNKRRISIMERCRILTLIHRIKNSALHIEEFP